MTIMSDMRHGEVEKKQGYAPVNGLSMYYEVQGAGKPLVYGIDRPLSFQR